MSNPASRTTLLAYLALVFGLLSMGFSGIFVSWANAPGAVTGFYRMLVAAVALAVPFAIRRWQNGSLPWREVRIAMLGGAFFAADLIFWNTGILISGATTPTLMGNTAPLWVGLGAMIFFREKLPRQFWLGLVLAIAGAAVVLGVDAMNEVGLGTFLGLLAGIFYGGYFLVTQRGRQKMDALSYFWVATTSSTVALLGMSLLLGQPLTGYTQFTYLNFVGLGLVVHVLGQLSFSYALGYLPASLVAPTGLGQPIVTAVLAGPLLGQFLSPLQIAGGLTVLAGVYLVHRSRIVRRRTAAAVTAG